MCARQAGSRVHTQGSHGRHSRVAHRTTPRCTDLGGPWHWMGEQSAPAPTLLPCTARTQACTLHLHHCRRQRGATHRQGTTVPAHIVCQRGSTCAHHLNGAPCNSRAWAGVHAHFMQPAAEALLTGMVLQRRLASWDARLLTEHARELDVHTAMRMSFSR